MKVNSMLAVACTALVITSCSNEEIVPVSMSKKVSVVLNLPAMAQAGPQRRFLIDCYSTVC